MTSYGFLGAVFLLAGCASTQAARKPDHAWADWEAINTCVSVAEIGIAVSGQDLNNAVRDRSDSLADRYTRLSRQLAPLMGISERDRAEIIAEEVRLRGFPAWDGRLSEEYGKARSELMAVQLRCETDIAVYQSRPWASGVRSE